MKTAHFETAPPSTQLCALPKRRSILLLQREKLEQEKMQEEQLRQKKLMAKGRAQRRKKFLKSPPVKLCANIGSAFWALFISLVLTLIACYLVTNPQIFSTLLRPVEQFFEISIAGAAPPSDERAKQSKIETLSVELTIDKELSPKYRGKEDEIKSLLGTVREHSQKGYSGTVTLKKIEVTPKVGRVKEKVDKVVELDRLPTNDLTQLPFEQSFTLRSDKGLDAKAEVFLKAAEWEWEVQTYDDFGLPKEYKARVTYRGEETWIDCKSLMVTAHYAGTLTKEIAAAVEPEQTAPPQLPQQPTPPQQRPTPAPAAPTPTPNLVPEQIVEEPPLEDVEVVVNEAQAEEPEVLEPAFIPAVEQPEEDDDEDNSKLWIALAAGLAGTAAVSTGTAAAVIFYRRSKRKLDEDEENLEDYHDDHYDDYYENH